MSEKIYACLLRLFPSHFREAYGDEALQLFRDRARNEKGFFSRVRLWLDLLADLAISIPRQYRYARPALTGAPVRQRLEGTPGFFVLVEESPGTGALIFGCALSMIALSLFSILLVHAGNRRPSSASAHQDGYPTDSRPYAVGHATEQTAGDSPDISTNASPVKRGEANSNDSQSNAFLPPGQFPIPRTAASSTCRMPPNRNVC